MEILTLWQGQILNKLIQQQDDMLLLKTPSWLVLTTVIILELYFVLMPLSLMYVFLSGIHTNEKLKKHGFIIIIDTALSNISQLLPW